MNQNAITLKVVNALFRKELRELIATKSFWVMLLVLCPLVGFSFMEAVFLYGNAGESVMGNELLLGRLSPLEGVVVPTFSAMYMSEVFLFPFVAIRLLGVEKQFGSLKFLLQLTPNLVAPLVVKLFIALIAFTASLLPALAAIAAWHSIGGYWNLHEILVLVLGHFLFALLIASIAFFSVAVTDSPQTAAIVTLTFTISSWVLEFAGQNQSSLNAVSWLSMTAHLRLFESALFSLQTLLGFLIASSTFLLLSCVWLRAADTVQQKLSKSLLTLVVVCIAALIARESFYFKDFSENRINSFHPRNEAELRKINNPLRIEIHLDPDDSIAVDFERTFLSKLRRVLKNFTVVYVKPKEPGASGQEDPRYGEINYDYNGVRLQSHDVGAPRALEVLHFLTGTRLEGEVDSPYPGHPVKADAGQFRFLFYVFMPGCILLLWMGSQRFLRQKGQCE